MKEIDRLKLRRSALINYLQDEFSVIERDLQVTSLSSSTRDYLIGRRSIVISILEFLSE